MSLDKKGDKKRLPDLPPLPINQLSSSHGFEHENEEIESNALPSFPDSLSQNGFSQNAIKGAVGDVDSDENNLDEIPGENNEHSKIVEMEEWSPSAKIRDEFPVPRQNSADNELPEFRPEIKNFHPEEFPGFNGRKSSKNSDIFVKLDKFRSVRRTLGNIQDKLEEIDNLLNKIRETKQREEQELAAWEKEITQVKSRIEDVTVNIFEKVE